ncbi:MAG: hypothetical protein HC854_03040 [Flavobacterium sp.]|nr:hypothetical protein [Flavobacterium sp.]
MKTISRLLLLVTFEWLVLLSFLSNMKDVASDYLVAKSNYSSIKYKDPTLCTSPQSMLLTVQPVRNGLWNDTSIWPNGILPTTNDDVVIPSGRVVTMVGTCRAKSLMVNGTLNAVNWQATGAWINLETESIMINSGGKLEIGTEAQPYYANENVLLRLKVISLIILQIHLSL